MPVNRGVVNADNLNYDWILEQLKDADYKLSWALDNADSVINTTGQHGINKKVDNAHYIGRQLDFIRQQIKELYETINKFKSE